MYTIITSKYYALDFVHFWISPGCLFRRPLNCLQNEVSAFSKQSEDIKNEEMKTNAGKFKDIRTIVFPKIVIECSNIVIAIPYRYEIKNNRSMEITIAFQNSNYLLANDEYKNTTAYIYSIEVTNTIGGGAKECKTCPRGTNKQG